MRMSCLVGHFVLSFEVPDLDYTGASDSDREYNESSMDLAGRMEYTITKRSYPMLDLGWAFNVHSLVWHRFGDLPTTPIRTLGHQNKFPSIPRAMFKTNKQGTLSPDKQMTILSGEHSSVASYRYARSS